MGLFLAFLVALSFCNNPIDSGETIDARQAAKHTPGGGQRTAAQAAGSCLSSPKFQKEQKDPFSLRH